MPLFRVLHFENGTGGECVEHRNVEAADAETAAELICGEPVVENQGKLGQLRAQIQREDDLAVKRMFYVH